MDKKILIFLIIAVFIAFGFLMGAIYDFGSSACTQMACSCQNQGDEVPCNFCGSSDPRFMTFIFNVEKSCSSREIVLCKNNEPIGKRLDIDYGSCKYRLNFFGGEITYWKLLIFGYNSSGNTEVVSVNQTN